MKHSDRYRSHNMHKEDSARQNAINADKMQNKITRTVKPLILRALYFANFVNQTKPQN